VANNASRSGLEQNFIATVIGGIKSYPYWKLIPNKNIPCLLNPDKIINAVSHYQGL